MLTPPLNAPPFISLVLMKVGALIGGWRRKPVNQCKSWSCLKYQATVEGGHGMLASRGEFRGRGKSGYCESCGKLRAIMVWFFPKVVI